MAGDTQGETIHYQAGSTELVGWAATGKGDGPRPGVVVVHEWWGLNDYIRGRANQLAELGYEAVAADMYGGGQTASDPEGATALMSAALGDVPALEQKLQAAVDALKARPGVDGSKIAAIGYCFGGAVVLHGARRSPAFTARWVRFTTPHPAASRRRCSSATERTMLSFPKATSRL